MVNYQGPEVLRGLVEATEIPIFNRVSEIKYLVLDPTTIELAREDVSRMQELRQITVAKKRAKAVSETEVNAVAEIVPPCRLASVKTKPTAQIEVGVSRGSLLTCSSQ